MAFMCEMVRVSEPWPPTRAQAWSSESEKGGSAHSMWYYLSIYFFISMAQIIISLVNQVRHALLSFLLSYSVFASFECF